MVVQFADWEYFTNIVTVYNRPHGR